MRDSILNVRSSGLGGAVKSIKRASKHIDKGRAKVNKHIGKKLSGYSYERGKERMADRMSSADRNKFILSETKKEMDKQKKRNKKKYGYENYNPVRADKIYSKKLKSYGEKARKQRTGGLKPKYNKWGDRIG